jgi:hypothetical protein
MIFRREVEAGHSKYQPRKAASPKRSIRASEFLFCESLMKEAVSD